MTTGGNAPTRFGRYELREQLGAGGMAVVHHARYTVAPGVSRAVVIKRVRDPYAQDPAFVAMFLNEARISMGLSHGNIVQVFDFGQEAGEYFLAMEFVDGQPLSRVLKRARVKGLAHLPAPLAVGLVLEVCKGLHHAHTRRDEQGRPLGLVHRDVSPDNVLVSFEGEVKLTDFGIAKAQHSSGRPDTEAGVVRGKYLYLSPEQTRGEALDGRSDVYAAGVVLFELLTGHRPVEGSPAEVMSRVARGELTPAHTYTPDLDPALEALLARALAPRRDDRFPSAEDFQRALAEWLAYRAPLFPASTLRHMMGWLFQEDLKARGHEPQLPESFLRQVMVWTGEGGTQGPREPERASAVHRAHAAAFPEEYAPAALGQGLRGEESPGVPVWAWVAAGVGVLVLAVYLLLAVTATAPTRPMWVVTNPPGAEVRWDGQRAGTTPTRLAVPTRGEASHSLELLFVGFHPWQTSIQDGAAPERVQVTLVRLPAEPEGRAPSPAPVADKDAERPKAKGKAGASRESYAEQWEGRSSDAAAAHLLGLHQLQVGNVPQARAEFRRCLEVDAAAAPCHLELGRLSARASQSKDARQHFAAYLKLSPHGSGADEARRYLANKAP